MGIPRELDMKLFPSPVQIRPLHSVHGTVVPQRQLGWRETSNKLCKCPMARRASGALGWVVQGLWSDGKSMLPLLLPAQFLQILPTLLQYPQILTTRAPLGDPFSLHEDICGLQLRNSGFQPSRGRFLQQLAIRSVSIPLIAYEFHSEQHESH